MAYILTSGQFAEGLQSYSAMLLQTLRHFTLVSPFTITAARTQLETSQIQPFSDAAFDQLLNEIYSLDLDNSSLTAAEITVLNVIRDYLEPSGSVLCCGTDPVTASDFTKVFNDRVGSATFEKEAQAQLEPNVTCDVYQVELTLTPGAGSPALVTNPVTLNSLGCVSGKHTLSYLWLDFVSNPSGFFYDLQYDFKDSSGVVLAKLFDTITF